MFKLWHQVTHAHITFTPEDVGTLLVCRRRRDNVVQRVVFLPQHDNSQYEVPVTSANLVYNIIYSVDSYAAVALLTETDPSDLNVLMSSGGDG